MSENPISIEHLRIAAPCPMNWERMTGDDRVRFCAQCQLQVYNISELTRGETEKLISSTEGRICGRLFRRADGTILTKDCPVGLRALRRRVARRAAAVFAALISLSAAAFGQTISAKDKTPQTKITRTSSPNQTATGLSGAVRDASKSVVPGAKISITNIRTNETTETKTNDEGRFEFVALAEGIYTITVDSPGFVSFTLSDVLVGGRESIEIDVVLEASELMGVIIMDLVSPIDSKPGATIISGDVIRRLPI